MKIESQVIDKTLWLFIPYALVLVIAIVCMLSGAGAMALYVHFKDANVEQVQVKKSGKFALNLTVCNAGFCNEYVIDSGLTWEDCWLEADSSKTQSDQIIWACIPMFVE